MIHLADHATCACSFFSPCSALFVFQYQSTTIGDVGAIFREDQRDSFYDLAFKFAVHKINKDPRILPKNLLTYDIQYVDKDDSFHTNKQGL